MTAKKQIPDESPSQAEWAAIADDLLPGGALGTNMVPKDERFVIRRGKGSQVEDMEGNWHIDYVLGAGALILGHAHPAPMKAVEEQLAKGIHFFGALNEACLHLARELTDAIPCAERLAFTTTGSEATFYALRLARAFTGRPNVLKFEGAYHGNHDYSQVSVSPDAATNFPAGRPDSAGVPEVLPPTVLIAPYNDLETTRKIVEENRDDLACIIVEPVQRVIFSEPDFLSGLRKICDDNDVLLVFDEVVTGFRLAYGGAQEYFSVTLDIAAYGKIAGGGAPLGAVAGKAEIIDFADPARRGNGDYAQVNGTLHGNPLASAAGLATLKELQKPGFYDDLNAKADDLRKACQDVLDKHRLEAIACGKGSWWQILFLDKPPRDYADVRASDLGKSKALDMGCLAEGLYVLPGIRRFVSAVHTGDDFEETVRALDSACRGLN
jgi:glutamate-1-semialdehyde 2,1-aminomutase